VGPPVIVNVPVALPLGIFTLVDDRETNPVLSCESVTLSPVLGAGEFSVIVPVTVFPTPTLFELNVSVMVACPTLIVPKYGLRPGAEAMMVVDPGLSGVIVAGVLNAPGRTVTVGGAVATVGSTTVSVIAWPLGPAADPSVTV